MKNILVTGANGKIGQELVIKAAETGYSVKAAVRDKSKSDRINLDNTELINFEYEKPETWDYALEDIDFVYLLASAQISNPFETIKPFLSKVYEHKPKHITFSTAMGIERADRTPLRDLELDIMSSKINHTFLRPNWFMQNFFTSLKSKIKEEGKLILPAGDAKVSFIDTRDIAESVLKSFEDDNMINKGFTLTGSEAIDHFEVAGHISDATGKEIKYIPVMLIEYRKMLKEMGFSDDKADGIITIFDMMAKGYASPVSDDLPEKIGIKPIKFSQFAKDYANYWI